MRPHASVTGKIKKLFGRLVRELEPGSYGFWNAVTAEKEAQANLIRRREETAATRSLLSTAKLMEDNPLLVRLKELETLEKVAEKVEKITVFGGLEGLLERTIKLGVGWGHAPPTPRDG